MPWPNSCWQSIFSEYSCTLERRSNKERVDFCRQCFIQKLELHARLDDRRVQCLSNLLSSTQIVVECQITTCHVVPPTLRASCGWDECCSDEGISSFFKKLFPFFFKRGARIAIKPLIKTVVRSANTVGKKAIKSASKHGIKKLVKEVAKEGASEIAKLGTKKLLENIDTISNKAKRKGVPAHHIDKAAAAIKKGVQNASNSLNKSAAKNIDNWIPTNSVAKKKGKPAASRS